MTTSIARMCIQTIADVGWGVVIGKVHFVPLMEWEV